MMGEALGSGRHRGEHPNHRGGAIAMSGQRQVNAIVDGKGVA